MKKTKIDWCDSTWNPVSGCYHSCEYCYARKIAERFRARESREKIYELNAPMLQKRKDGSLKKAAYPYGFTPTIYRYKLDEVRQWTKPRNIFVCSMADLFGDWVPDEWIKDVLAVCKNTSQHNYLFLTKNPKRYEKILTEYMPPNMWFGWSQTEPLHSETLFETHHSVKTFVSIEPLLKPFENLDIKGVEWVIIGAETGNMKDKVIPKREWIENIVNACKKEEVPIFMKSSLAWVWGEPLIQEFPIGLQIQERSKE